MADSAVIILEAGKRKVKNTNLDASRVIISGSFMNSGQAFCAGASAIYETVSHILWAGSTLLGTPSSIFMTLATKTSKQANFRIFDRTNALVVAEVTAFANTDSTPTDMGTITNISAMQSDWVIQIQRNEAGAEGRVSAILGIS